jgi:glyoxylase-like metal-dependent hydrolase (beta-lactamase superfamily II)
VTSPDQALEEAREAGIHRLQIPTPFAVGRVNCYLIEDEPLTLVDTGPNSGKALDELMGQLEALERSLEEIELVILTHQHIDHLGLVEIIASRSGAEVAAIDVVVPFVENFGDDIELDDRFAAELMLRHGIPEEVVIALRSVARSFRAWGAKAKVSRPLRDGEMLEFRQRALEVQLRPGHSPSDTLFWDPERRILLCADHLIAHISSNPLISRPLDGSEERPRALMMYLESLRRTRELPARILLPGHGDPITDHRTLIDERFAHHDRRAERIHGLIAERPRTAYEIAQELWGNVAVTQAFLTLSEVLGHVDLLMDSGRVREVQDGDVVRFEAVD